MLITRVLRQFLSFGEELKSDAIPSLGQTAVRHYRLIQRANDPYKRQVDIWLAKDLEWGKHPNDGFPLWLNA